MTALRAIGGVILGFVTWSLLQFGFFSGVWAVLKAERSFQPDAWEVSTTWCVAALVVGPIAGLAAGIVCGKLAVGPTASRVLAGLVFVFAAFAIYPALNPPDLGPRPAEMTMAEAMTNARKPIWSALADPILSAVFILGGASLVSKKQSGE